MCGCVDDPAVFLVRWIGCPSESYIFAYVGSTPTRTTLASVKVSLVVPQPRCK